MTDRPYIIAEIGANHNGDMDLAKQMIDSAAECGCDAAKFQSWTPNSLISSAEYSANQKYNDSPKKHFGSLKEMVDKYYLREDQHFELNQYCKQIGITFCSTPFSDREVAILVECDVPFIKVASMDITNPILLQTVARTKKPVILSTGMATLGEIESAVKILENNGSAEITLLHCISIYPPEYEDINLKNIEMLKSVFGLPVGLSDHSIGTAIPLAAIAMGATIIEKHFTLDKNLEGWDHDISADPAEMRSLVREGQNVFKALGSNRRTLSEAEKNKKLKFRRSLVSATSLREGHIVTLADLDLKRPGTGIPSERIFDYVGKVLAYDIEADILLKDEHFR